MAEKMVKVDYWAKRWEEGDSPWHKSFIHPCLEQHYQKLMPSSCQTLKARIFLPLCGKSLDMILLEEKGFQVVGLEGVESVIQAFFQENNIEYETKNVSDEVKSFHGIGKDITIFAMDIFKVSDGTLGGYFDAVWDRGSLSAIGLYAENRGKKYADILAGLLKPNGRIMVENHIYKDDAGPHRGPPSHVPPEVLNELFSEKFAIERINVEMIPNEGRPFHSVYNLMTLKGQ